MGCSASTLDSEQSVTRCKDRKHFIKLAVRHRHAFAAAHAAYIQSLKNTGAAIRQFGDGESKDTPVTEMPSNTPNLGPLPPPMPHFLASPTPGPTSPISRAVSMPPLRNAATASPVKNPSPNSNPNHSFSHSRSPSPNPNFSPARNPSLSPVRNPSLSPPGPVQEEEEEEDDDAAVRKESYGVADAKPPPPPPSELPAPPPPPPPKASPWEFLDVFPSTTDSTDDVDTKAESQKLEEKQAPLQDGAIIQKAELQELHEQLSIEDKGAPSLPPHIPAKAKMQGSGQEFSHILRELDDHFLAAFESGKEVARLLEARKMHYHSNFANANDSLDHSLRVLRVMSWGRNPQLPLTNGERIDFFHCGEKETHASTLDKLLAWEKKLHDEVKAGEVIRIELERKSVQLKSQKKREENSVTLNKTKALVKSLQTRYLVEIQAVDAATSEVDKLRDECLHIQLVDLVKELMDMWNCMLKCHRQQYQLIKNVESLDSSYSPTTTNDFHSKNTLQLKTEVNLWHQNFDKLLTTQKEYINAVYQWLRLHIIQIESDDKETPGSPAKMSTPPVYHLCRAWLSALNKIPGNVTLQALKAFSNIIHELSLQQDEEFKQKRKLDGLRKELERKEQIFKAQEMKYNERRLVQQSIDEKEEMAQEGGNPLKEKERMVKLLRETVEAENEKYVEMCSKSGSMSLTSLQKGLPPVLNAIEDFAHTCFQCYTELHSLTLMDDSPTLQIGY